MSAENSEDTAHLQPSTTFPGELDPPSSEGRARTTSHASTLATPHLTPDGSPEKSSVRSSPAISRNAFGAMSTFEDPTMSNRQKVEITNEQIRRVLNNGDGADAAASLIIPPDHDQIFHNTPAPNSDNIQSVLEPALQLPQPLPTGRGMSNLQPPNLQTLSYTGVSEKEAANNSNATAVLVTRLKEYKAIREKYPYYVAVELPSRCINFHLTIMRLASETGKTYHARQIGLGAGGTGLNEDRCKGLYLRAKRFFFDLVKTRFFLDRLEHPELIADIRNHHDNRCFVTNLLLTGELTKGPLSPDGQAVGMDNDNSPRLMPLIPHFEDSECGTDFWNCVSNLTGHPEWVEQYGNAKVIDMNPSKYLLLQSFVATEFSRFKYAVGPPKENNGCRLFQNPSQPVESEIDIHALTDLALSIATGEEKISSTRYERCDRDLLDLHLFLFKLLNDSEIGSMWISDEEWNESGFQSAQSIDYDAGSDVDCQQIEELSEENRRQIADKARYNLDHGKETPEDHRSELLEKGDELEKALDDPDVPNDGDLIATLQKEYDLLSRALQAEAIQSKARVEVSDKYWEEVIRAGRWE